MGKDRDGKASHFQTKNHQKSWLGAGGGLRQTSSAVLQTPSSLVARKVGTQQVQRFKASKDFNFQLS